MATNSAAALTRPVAPRLREALIGMLAGAGHPLPLHVAASITWRPRSLSADGVTFIHLGKASHPEPLLRSTDIHDTRRPLSGPDTPFQEPWPGPPRHVQGSGDSFFTFVTQTSFHDSLVSFTACEKFVMKYQKKASNGACPTTLGRREEPVETGHQKFQEFGTKFAFAYAPPLKNSLVGSFSS
jgi:hypothetical protein